MKKVLSVFLVLCIILSFSGCNNVDNNSQETNEEYKLEYINGDIIYDEFELWYYDPKPISEDIVQFYTDGINIFKEGRSIDTKEEAVEFGEELLKEYQEKGLYQDYRLLSISHAIIQNFWIYIYCHRDAIGGGTTIVVDGNHGEFMRGWISE